MKKRIQLVVALLAVSMMFSGVKGQSGDKAPLQNFCGTQVPDQQWDIEFNKLVEQLSQAQASGRQQAQVFTIPVIMHVIHGGQAVGTYPNLSQGQLVSQIQTLNNDYGGIGYNTWNYPSAAYVTWAINQALPSANLDALGRVKIANCNVQFCLATKDTLGNTLPEPGIERINYTTRAGWSNPASFGSINSFRSFIDNTVKPATIWNVTRYLNIWVTDININATGLLGYATFPPLTTLSGLTAAPGTSTTDGYWCYARAYGSVNYYPSGTYYSGYDKGRTSSHEIGHYLGLRHIWGDGSCATDYCNDTPPAANSNSGAPPYPFHAGTCTGNSPNGEMYMNFMDYTDDNSKYMFTTDQATRIQTAMSTSPYRKFLGTHNLCSILPVATTASFNIAANACNSAVLTLSNMTNGTPLPTYTWSANGPGSAVFNPNPNSALTASFTAPGVYTVTLVSSSGTTSSTFTKIININANPSLTLSIPSQTVCTDQEIDFTASGAGLYTWQPDGLSGAVVSYPPGQSTQVYTCTGIGTGNCKSTATIVVNVIDCTGLSANSAQENMFRIFPNPASDQLFVKLYGAGISVEIVDALGKRIMEQACTAEKDRADIQLNISALPAGLYFVKLKTQEGVRQTLRMIKAQ